MQGGKIHRRSFGQIPVLIGGGPHVEQLVDAPEKPGFRIGFCQPRQCCIGRCGHRIATMACQGETSEGRVTQFGIPKPANQRIARLTDASRISRRS